MGSVPLLSGSEAFSLRIQVVKTLKGTPPWSLCFKEGSDHKKVGIAFLKGFFRVKNFPVVRINYVQCKQD